MSFQHNINQFFLFRHYGDLGNIEESNGQASVDITDDYVELFGLYSVKHRSFVVREKTLAILQSMSQIS